ncbi:MULTISPECIES: ATP-grasp domain-containing protein [unclassified Streptomyces]|uniref:ATP-grasp domain-containing protein n=1 Tax=unclassified Streptomyces TaxID=2593676 RepID=UPI0036EF1290
MQRKPRLGVVYDVGSAHPREIFLASRRLCEPVFLVHHDTAGPGTTEIPTGAVDLTGASPAQAAGILRDLDIEHITTFSDRQLVRTAEIAEAAGLRFLSVEAAVACTDKLVQRRTLAEAGIDTIRMAPFTAAGAFPMDVGLPLIVKPRYGAGSVDTLQINSPAEAQQWAGEMAERSRTVPGTYSEFIVEELLQGDSNWAGPDFGDFVSVESMVEAGRVRHLCVTGKFPLAAPFREAGMLVPSTVSAEVEQHCRDLAEAALRALGVDNVITHTEMKLTSTGPRIIEVNGRPPGYTSELLRRATGGRFDMVGAALRIALGLPAGDLPVLSDQVTYVYFLQPPLDAIRLIAMNEPGAVSSVRGGVRRFDPYVRPGASLDWRWGTSGHIGLILGEAADHQTALAEIDAAIRALDVTYELGKVSRMHDELPQDSSTRAAPGYEEYEEVLRRNLPYAKDKSLTGDSSLQDLGLDSLGTVRLLADLEETFDCELPDEALEESTFASVDSLWQAFRNATVPA